MGRRYVIKRANKYYVERNRHGQFKKWTSKHRSLSRDVRQHAKTVVKAGYGYEGDQRIAKPKKHTRRKGEKAFFINRVKF